MTATRGTPQHRLQLQRQQPIRQTDNNKPNFPLLNEGKYSTRGRSQDSSRDARTQNNLTYKKALLSSHNLTTQHTSQDNQVTDLQVLSQEMAIFQNLVDVRLMLELVRELNLQLTKCKSPIDKFQTFYNLATQLNNGGI